MANEISNPLSDIIMYKKDDGTVNIEILVQNETLWLTQERMAQLFGVDRTVITKHLGNIFKSGELVKESVCAKIAHTASDGKKYNTQFYNLDAILSVGYRVNSRQATLFRIFASQVLKEYLIKGFVMDDERLKNPHNIFGKDYFDEQLERIRDIRSSERRFYQKITDIYAQCSADYDVNAETTKKFFATVQNKLHFAISGQTAAEIIYNRVDSEKENMGLTTWRNAPKGKIRKPDVIIAKNYLQEDEIKNLNEIVTMYLDYAERQAKKGIVMYMTDWVNKLDAFLQFNEEDILQGNGKITHAMAVALAESEYEKYKIKQDKEYLSDFDRLLLEIEEKN